MACPDPAPAVPGAPLAARRPVEQHGGTGRRQGGAAGQEPLVTRRGVLTLLLGVAIYVVAWLFGAKALYPVATGLVLAAGAARVWVGLAAAPIQLRRRAGKGALLE